MYLLLIKTQLEMKFQALQRPIQAETLEQQARIDSAKITKQLISIQKDIIGHLVEHLLRVNSLEMMARKVIN